MLFDYVDTGRLPGGPVTVHVDITNRCNLDCITCWNYSPYVKSPKPAEWKNRQMTLPQFESIVTQLEAAGVRKLIISGGGEPFTHPDIYRMIGAANAAEFHVTVITNALLIDPDRLLENGPDKLLVNLCAASPGTYRRFHPNTGPGDFEKLTDCLRRIDGDIPVTLVMVISNANYRELPGMARLAAGFPNVRLSFKRAGLTEDTARFALTPEQAAELADTLVPETLEICNKYNIPHNLDVFEHQLSGRESGFPIHETGCFAGLFYSRIFTDGSVFFCCSHIGVGNVFEKSFREIWTSAEYNRLRQRMDRKEFFPECTRCGKFNLNFKARELLDQREGEPGRERTP